ncbi:hypothetical protein [Nocardia sp. NBC_01327]|uniref:hypothetical protein n=1 Tax=Nocardia sp. NBC_01327 TaxID=2903593 RepID=UPI002E13C75D|nr:hypothetical protein OG326_37450 [Nocardia sp. NBC_01327]
MSKTTVTQYFSRIAIAGFALAALSAGTAQAAPIALQPAEPAAPIATTTDPGTGSSSGSLSLGPAVPAQVAGQLRMITVCPGVALPATGSLGAIPGSAGTNPCPGLPRP